MRIICLIVFLSLGSSLCAESVRQDQNNNVAQTSSEKRIDTVISTEDKKNVPVDLLTKNSALLPENRITTKPSVSQLSNWPVVIMALLGMIFLILALGWLVKRFSGVNFSGGQNMKIMSSLALGAKERVSLVEVNGTQFLLGVTSQSINHLHTFDTELSGKEMYSEEDKFSLELKNKNRKGGFSEKLNQLLDNKLNSSNTDELEK